MVNTAEFTKRLNQIMDYYDLSAAGFADRINVGRSSISHLLSGRNKPSLDFVMKVIQTFPEVELYWLLNGKGVFPGSTKAQEASIGVKKEFSTSPGTEQNLFSQEEEIPSKTDFESKLISPRAKAIKKIVIFYEDNSFEAFEN